MLHTNSFDLALEISACNVSITTRIMGGGSG